MDERLELLTALEACRPASDDLLAPERADLAAAIQSDPVLARRFEATQRWDASVRDALQQGDPPEGLEGRILAALGEDAELSPERRPASPSQVGRRHWWLGLAAAATVAAIAVGAAVWSMVGGSDPLTPSAIHERAIAWCDSLAATKWQQTQPPVEYPFAPEVMRSPDAWQRISLPDGLGKGVAYRLPPPPGGSVRQMTLFVLKADVADVGTFPPANPYRTMDRLVATWQIGDNVYVLVIQGDDLGALQDLYHRSVKTSGRMA